MIAGRTALVTGAGNGLGRAIAIALASSGARVVLCGRNLEKLRDVEQAIGDNALSETCDTSDEGSVADLATRLVGEEISILINNAGIAGPVAPLVDVALADWDDVFAVNVRGVFLMCRA